MSLVSCQSPTKMAVRTPQHADSQVETGAEVTSRKVAEDAGTDEDDDKDYSTCRIFVRSYIGHRGENQTTAHQIDLYGISKLTKSELRISTETVNKKDGNKSALKRDRKILELAAKAKEICDEFSGVITK